MTDLPSSPPQQAGNAKWLSCTVHQQQQCKARHEHLADCVQQTTTCTPILAASSQPLYESAGIDHWLECCAVDNIMCLATQDVLRCRLWDNKMSATAFRTRSEVPTGIGVFWGQLLPMS